MNISKAPSQGSAQPRPIQLTDRVYSQLKEEICGFRYLPGDRFSENTIAERMQSSRTPVREALTRLQRDGFVQVNFRSGWQVRPFNFKYFEQLYDLRIVLEEASVRSLCAEVAPPDLKDLKARWLVRPKGRTGDGPAASLMDEHFHARIVQSAGNQEIERVHQDVTERLRIVRRLNFTRPERIVQTYEEHAGILDALFHRKADLAVRLLTRHILSSRQSVKNITLRMLQDARSHR